LARIPDQNVNKATEMLHFSSCLELSPNQMIREFDKFEKSSNYKHKISIVLSHGFLIPLVVVFCFVREGRELKLEIV
jgi:predicted metal-binding protein